MPKSPRWTPIPAESGEGDVDQVCTLSFAGSPRGLHGDDGTVHGPRIDAAASDNDGILQPERPRHVDPEAAEVGALALRGEGGGAKGARVDLPRARSAVGSPDESPDL